MENGEKKYLISKELDEWAEITYPEEFLRLNSLIARWNTSSDKNSNRLEKKLNSLKRNFTDNYEIQVLKRWNQDKFFHDVENINEATSYKNLNSDFVCFGFSPSVYYLLGYEKVPFFMSARHVYTCMKKDGFIHESDTHYHNLGIDTIKSIPFSLDNVILIAQSTRHPESIVSVLDYDTPLLDENNNPTDKMTKLQVFIKPRREDISLYYSNLINEGNLIATSYDLFQTIDRNKILYVNKDKKSRVPQLVSADMQSRSITAVGHPRLNIHNIKRYIDDVKREMNISLTFDYALLQSVNTKLLYSQEKSNEIIEDCIKDNVLHEPAIPNLVQKVPSVSEEVNNLEQKQAGILDIVGKRFDVDEKGTPTFEGMKAISRAMEIYSDKHYETARYLFIKDGQIMRHIAVSAQTPSSTVIRPDERFLFSLRDYAKKTGSKIVFLHNHPSGYVEPSDADIKLTNYLANFFKRNGENFFSGHIILDHGTYGLYTEKTKEWGALIDGSLKPLNELRSHYELNVTEKSRIATFKPDSTISTQSLKELSEYAKQCDDGGTWNIKEWIPCLLLSSNGIVSDFDVINNYEFENIDVLSSKLKQIGREYGSENIVLFPRTSRQFLIAERFAQLTGKIKDIYFEKNDGTFELSQFPNGNIFNDLTRGDIKVSDSESYAEEVKVKIASENKKDIENRKQRYLDAVTSLENSNPLIQSEAIDKSNGIFVQNQKESIKNKKYLREAEISQKEAVSLFDKELYLFNNGQLEENHVFNLGKPGEILKNCGFPENDRIELVASRLKIKATQGNHPFEIMDILGLDKALQNPIAVFEYGEKEKAQNVIVNLEKDGKNFLVGVFFNQKKDGFEVSSIRGLFNRDNLDWMRWIQQGKMIYGDKERIQVLANQQRTNLADVNSKEARTLSDLYYLDSLDNILQNFADVKNVYTRDFPKYTEQKEKFEIFKQFRSAYQEIDSINIYDAAKDTDEFYKAIKNNDKSIIEKFTNGIEKPELASVASLILQNGGSHVQLKGINTQALNPNLRQNSESVKQDLKENETMENENTVESISSLQSALKNALKEVAIPLEKIDFTRENYNKLFPYSKIETPIESVKMGEHQFEKLEVKQREFILQATHDTLSNPDLIINEQKENVFGEQEDSHLYAKSFLINDKVHGVQSVVVSIDGENVSISTHERDINNFVNKIKKPDQLLYAAAKVRLLVERATGRQLVTVNPTREFEYVKSLDSNIQQDTESVKQELKGMKNEKDKGISDEELIQIYKQKYPDSLLNISENTRKELENVFSEIDDYVDKGTVPKERRFTLPKTPFYLQELGSDETVISLPVSVIKKAKETYGLSNEEIKNSLLRFYDPVVVFDTDKTKSENKQNSKLILTDEFAENKPIALAINTNSQIQVQENAHRKFIEVQDIRSIHDRILIAKNGTDLINQWTENGLCRYVDDKKISDWSTVARVYFPIEALQSDKNNILIKSEIVNSQEKPELKTYHKLKKEEIDGLKEIKQEEFNSIIDALYQQPNSDYKEIPPVIKLPQINEEIAQKLGVENANFFMRSEIAHVRPQRKGSYDQALRIEEMKGMLDFIKTCKTAYIDNNEKHQNFMLAGLDEQDDKKSNKIVFNKDENGNYIVTVGKVDTFNLEESKYSKVAVGVEPTIWMEIKSPSIATMLRSSTTSLNENIQQDTESVKQELKENKIMENEKTVNASKIFGELENTFGSFADENSVIEYLYNRSVQDEAIGVASVSDNQNVSGLFTPNPANLFSNQEERFKHIQELQNKQTEVLSKYANLKVVFDPENFIQSTPSLTESQKKNVSENLEAFKHRYTEDVKDKRAQHHFQELYPELKTHNLPRIQINGENTRYVNFGHGEYGTILPAFSIEDNGEEKTLRNFFTKEVKRLEDKNVFVVADGKEEYEISEDKYNEITSPENVEKFLNDIEKEYEEKQQETDEEIIKENLVKNALGVINENEISLESFEYKDFNFVPVRKFSDEEKTFLDSILSDKQNEKNLSKNSIFFAGYLEKQKPENEQHFEKALKVFDKDSFSKQAESDADIFYCKEKGTFYTSNGNYLVPLEFKIKAKNVEKDVFENRFSQEIKDFKIKNSEFLQNISPLVFNETEDKELMENISDVLSEGDTFTRKNQNLSSDVKIKLGELFDKEDSEKLSPTGLRHLIKHRIEERLNKGMSLEDSQKQVSCLLFLAVNNIDKAPAVKEPNGHYAIYKNGIKTVIGTDKKGHYVVTGFDYNNTSQEAEVAIGTGIARYGYTPEFLDIYAQVGASLASLGINISQSQEKSNNVSIDNTQRNSNSVSRTEEELRKELAAAEKKIEALRKKLEETLGQNNSLQRENSAIKDATPAKDNTPAKENQAVSKANQIQDSPGRRRNNEIDTKNFSSENAYTANTPVPKFGLKNKDGKIRIIDGAVFKKQILDEKDPAANKIVLELQKEDGTSEDVEISEFKYQNIINGVERFNKFKEEMGNEQTVKDWFTAHADYNQALLLDEFKQRENTADNFLHNFRARCLLDARNRDEAIKIAARMVKDMTFKERRAFNKFRNENGAEKYDNMLMDTFDEAHEQKEIAVNDVDIFYDVSFSNNPFERELIKSENRNLNEMQTGELIPGCKNFKVGDTIPISITTKGFDGTPRKTPKADFKIARVSQNVNPPRALLFNEKTKAVYLMSLVDLKKHLKKIERSQLKERRKTAERDYKQVGYDGPGY